MHPCTIPADAADRIVGTLSGGQMLRAGLACVLGEPKASAIETGK